MSEKNTESSGFVSAIFKRSSNKSPHRKLLGYLILLIAIIVVGTILVLVQRAHERANSAKLAASNECSSQAAGTILQQAAANLGPTQTQKLQPITAKIQKLPNYQQDPNCLYPIVIYYINKNDQKDAQLYLDKLHKVYHANVGLNRAYPQQTAPSVDDLRGSIASLQKFQKQDAHNIRGQ